MNDLYEILIQEHGRWTSCWDDPADSLEQAEEELTTALLNGWDAKIVKLVDVNK